jgi:hypothetical protein
MGLGANEMNDSTTKNIARSAIFIALAVALGYALSWVPNVELISFTVCFAGFALGAQWGAFVGASAFLLYSFLSPFGMAPLPLWIAQGIGGAIIGLSGGLFKKVLAKTAFAAVAGIVLTAIYDVLTNAAGFFAFPSGSTFIIYIVGGISFAAIHIFSNALVFAVFFPIISKRTAPFLKTDEV